MLADTEKYFSRPTGVLLKYFAHVESLECCEQSLINDSPGLFFKLKCNNFTRTTPGHKTLSLLECWLSLCSDSSGWISNNSQSVNSIFILATNQSIWSSPSEKYLTFPPLPSKLLEADLRKCWLLCITLQVGMINSRACSKVERVLLVSWPRPVGPTKPIPQSRDLFIRNFKSGGRRGLPAAQYSAWFHFSLSPGPGGWLTRSPPNFLFMSKLVRNFSGKGQIIERESLEREKCQAEVGCNINIKLLRPSHRVSQGPCCITHHIIRHKQNWHGAPWEILLLC